MPRYTIIVYRCPRCDTDLARQIRLMTSRVAPCPGCGRSVHVSMAAIRQNWGYCFSVVGGVLTWLVLGGLSLADRDFASMVARGMFKVITVQQHLLVVFVGCLAWAFVVAFCLAPIGAILGNIVVFLAQDRAPDLTGGVRGTLGDEPTPVPRVPVRRSLWVRLFFIFFWPAFFFVAALIAISILDGSLGEKNAVLRAQINARSCDQFALPTLGVTLILFALGGVGMLPWTGRTKMVPASAASGSAALLPGPLGTAAQDEGRPRNIFVRLGFVLLWPLLFFLATATILATIACAGAENEEISKQLAAQSGQNNAAWILLITLAVFVFGCLGLLPWTGRKKRSTTPTGEPTSLANPDEKHQTSSTDLLMDLIQTRRR